MADDPPGRTNALPARRTCVRRAPVPFRPWAVGRKGASLARAPRTRIPHETLRNLSSACSVLVPARTGSLGCSLARCSDAPLSPLLRSRGGSLARRSDASLSPLLRSLASPVASLRGGASYLTRVGRLNEIRTTSGIEPSSFVHASSRNEHRIAGAPVGGWVRPGSLVPLDLAHPAYFALLGRRVPRRLVARSAARRREPAQDTPRIGDLRSRRCVP